MKKRFPSQIKYQENNPNTTFRTTKTEREMIIQMTKKSGKTISQLVRIALLNLEKDFSIGYNNAFEKGKQSGYSIGYKEGYREGRSKGSEDWRIWVECYNCHQDLYIEPNTPEHKKIMDFMKGYFKHYKCSKNTQE